MSTSKVCYNYDCFQESLKNESFEKVVLEINEQYDTTESRKALENLKEIATNPKAELRLTIDDDELDFVKNGGLNQYNEQELSKIKNLNVAFADKEVLGSILKLNHIKQVEVKDQTEQSDIKLSFVFESNETNKISTTFDEIFLNGTGESFSKLNKLTLNTSIKAITKKFNASTLEQEWNTLVEKVSNDSTLKVLKVQFLYTEQESEALSTVIVSQGLYKVLSSSTSNITNVDILSYNTDNLDQQLLEGLKESKSIVHLTIFDKHFKQIVSSVLLSNKSIKDVNILSSKNNAPVECLEIVKKSLALLNEFSTQITSLDSLKFYINVENINVIQSDLTNKGTTTYPVKSINVVNIWNSEQIILQVKNLN